MPEDYIRIKGARTHNLKNISLDIPKNKMVVITGLSGSGKSSLAFDTIYAEGQRRYVESLSSYARQFLGMMEKPDVDSIEGLSPAISIDQKTTSHNPRSTVGTVTEIYDYLRILFARVGIPFCPNDNTEITAKTSDQIVQEILIFPLGSKLQILAPMVKERKGSHSKIIDRLRKEGFSKIIVDGEVVSLEENDVMLDKNKNHSLDLIVDRIVLSEQSDDLRFRIADAVEIAIKNAQGLVKILCEQKEFLYSTQYSCPQCGFSFPDIHPRLFSFNSPEGACSECNGIGHVLKPAKDLLFDLEMSIAQGGIKFLGNLDSSKWYKSLFEGLAKKYQFSLKTRLKDLPKKVIEVILKGTNNDVVKMNVQGEHSKIESSKPFEGIISLIERRYLQTESDKARLYYTQFMRQEHCPTCSGLRLKPELQSIKVNQISIGEITSLAIKETLSWFEHLSLTETQMKIVDKLLPEITSRLTFLLDVGLDYLTLHRRSDTLSGGEMQRIRLASQIGTKLTGVLYVLDEPSIGLHQKDNDKLIKTLLHLKNLGNSLIIVEHDEQIIREADFVIDIGPYAGVDGGSILATGDLKAILENKESLTTAYLLGDKQIAIPSKRREGNQKILSIKGIQTNNLKNIDLILPLGKLIAVTGVSGSGKSSLIIETLLPVVSESLGFVQRDNNALYQSLEGLEYVNSIISIDQSPIGRTPRSNPSTYVGLFGFIRDVFATTNEAKLRGYTSSRFSFNVKGGRCESCNGDGIKKIEMHFLADVYVPCEICKGKRYNRETLDIYFKGKNIYEILEMSVLEAFEFFENHPKIQKILQTLKNVGLEYIKLGQNSITLSGGEAQRIKLSKELSKRFTGNTLYILDEPTTGLHFADVHKLTEVLNHLVDKGNTVVIIEHNLDIIKIADHIIDIGPNGGSDGGFILAEGIPEKIAHCQESYTGQYLKKLL